MSKNAENTYIGTITNDGGALEVSSEELAEYQQEARTIADGTLSNYNSGQWSGHWNQRHCIWPNQSPDGRKREKYFKDSDTGPRPFDGATDARVRESDMIVNELVEKVVLASELSVLRVKPVGVEDSEKAANLRIMLDYYLDRMGLKKVRELARVANFMFSGTPAVGVLGLNWRREMAIELRELSLAELMGMAVETQLEAAGVEADEAAVMLAAENFVAVLSDPNQAESVEVVAAMIMKFFPSVKEARAKTMVRQIRSQLKKGTPQELVVVDFPNEYIRLDEPEFTALEVGRDLFMATDTDNFEDAWGYFTADLLTKSEVETMAAAEDWNEEAVKQVLGNPDDDANNGIAGRAHFSELRWTNGNWVYENDVVNKNRYEIITAVNRGTTPDGVPGVFQVKFAMNVTKALTKKELRKDKHGQYPAVAFVREYIDRLMMDARGVSALEEPMQGLKKLFVDTCGDNAQFAGVPPLISRGRMGGGRAYVEPMEEIKLRAGGKFDWMQVPNYPATAMKMIELLSVGRDDYWGRLNPALPPERARLRDQFTIMMWLKHLQDAYVMLSQLIQQYAPEEVVVQVLNEAGRLGRSRADIQGRFDVRVEFDSDVLNPETLEKKLGMMKNVLLAMDTDQRVDKGAVIEYFMMQLNPSLAKGAIKSQEDAQLSEIQDEMQQYQNIRAGLPTNMPTDGSINAEVRMMLYGNLEQQDPRIYADMAEDKQEKLKERIEYLQHQQQQYGENAQTGRTGVSATMGGEMSGAMRGGGGEG